MYLYDSLMADKMYDAVARTFIAGAPDEEQAEKARAVFQASDEGWRVVARTLAELSPSLLRVCDLSRITSAIHSTIPQFYYELQVPAPRLEKVEKIAPYATGL